MAYLVVNGVALPNPSSTPTYIRSTEISEGINESNQFYGQRVGRDRYKIDGLEWNYLSDEQWSTILRVLEPFVVDVYCHIPTVGWVTRKYYVSDREAVLDTIDSKGKPVRWKNCKFTLTDCGW